MRYGLPHNAPGQGEAQRPHTQFLFGASTLRLSNAAASRSFSTADLAFRLYPLGLGAEEVLGIGPFRGLPGLLMALVAMGHAN